MIQPMIIYLFIENKTSIDTEKFLSRKKKHSDKKENLNTESNDVQRFSCRRFQSFTSFDVFFFIFDFLFDPFL